MKQYDTVLTVTIEQGYNKENRTLFKLKKWCIIGEKTEHFYEREKQNSLIIGENKTPLWKGETKLSFNREK